MQTCVSSERLKNKEVEMTIISCGNINLEQFILSTRFKFVTCLTYSRANTSKP